MAVRPGLRGATSSKRSCATIRAPSGTGPPSPSRISSSVASIVSTESGPAVVILPLKGTAPLAAPPLFDCATDAGVSQFTSARGVMSRTPPAKARGGPEPASLGLQDCGSDGLPVVVAAVPVVPVATVIAPLPMTVVVLLPELVVVVTMA